MYVFSLSDFSFPDTDDYPERGGTENTILILYHFHPLTNIKP